MRESSKYLIELFDEGINWTLLLLQHAVVVIGFDQIFYMVSEGISFLNISFGIQNNAHISSHGKVDVQFQTLNNSAMGE